MPNFRVTVRVTRELVVETFASNEQAAAAIAVGIAETSVLVARHAQIASSERVRTEVMGVDQYTAVRGSP